MDYSAVFALEEKVSKLKSNSITAMFVVNDTIRETLIRNNITDSVPISHIFRNFDDAVAHAKEHIQQDICLK